MTDERGAPVGRRVFLGLVGLGAAGVVVGAKVQNWLEQVIAPIEAKDFTGLTSLLPFGNYRFYSITGNFPHRARDQVHAAGERARREAVHDLLRGSSRRCPP